jgi:hypothetical protein
VDMIHRLPAVRMWVNGTPQRVAQGSTRRPTTIKIHLKEGWNRLLVKAICDKAQMPWGSRRPTAALPHPRRVPTDITSGRSMAQVWRPASTWRGNAARSVTSIVIRSMNTAVAGRLLWRAASSSSPLPISWLLTRRPAKPSGNSLRSRKPAVRAPGTTPVLREQAHFLFARNTSAPRSAR